MRFRTGWAPCRHILGCRSAQAQKSWRSRVSHTGTQSSSRPHPLWAAVSRRAGRTGCPPSSGPWGDTVSRLEALSELREALGSRRADEALQWLVDWLKRRDEVLDQFKTDNIASALEVISAEFAHE